MLLTTQDNDVLSQNQAGPHRLMLTDIVETYLVSNGRPLSAGSSSLPASAIACSATGKPRATLPHEAETTAAQKI